jgi:hypothetical protein
MQGRVSSPQGSAAKARFAAVSLIWSARADKHVSRPLAEPRMAAVEADEYGKMLLQSRDKHPIKKHLSLFARRRLRRAIRISRDPMPWVARKAAALGLKAGDAPKLSVRDADGYVLIPRGFIQGMDEIIAYSRRVWDRHRERLAAKNNYFLKFSHFMDIAEFRDIVRAALQEPVLKLTSDYLGGVPVLKDLNLWWTRPWPEVGGAQNYHIDSIPDTRSLRFLIGLTDIDDDAGPLSLLPADKSAALIKKLGYLGGVVDPDVIVREYGSQAIVSAKGPAGAGVAIDTGRCFHFGSRDMKKDRLMLSISFSSCYLNEQFPDQSKWVASTEGLSKIEKMVLNVR